MNFLQLIISGISVGTLYALFGIGVVLLYRVSNVVNFSHSQFGIVALYVTYLAVDHWNIPVILSLIIGILVSLALGMFTERFIIRGLPDEPHLVKVIVTLGCFMVLTGLTGYFMGYETREFSMRVRDGGVLLGDAYWSYNAMVSLVVTFILIVGVALLLKYTKIGIAMRAVAHNAQNARLMGIPANTVLGVTWGISALFALVIGIFAVPTTALRPEVLDAIFFNSFAAIILGGFGSIIGSAIGGIIFGIIESVFMGYFSAEYKQILVFFIILILLWFKPNGLFGKPEVKKV